MDGAAAVVAGGSGGGGPGVPRRLKTTILLTL